MSNSNPIAVIQVTKHMDELEREILRDELATSGFTTELSLTGEIRVVEYTNPQ